ncbi:O-antigen ligase family protein [Crenobacter caeni]|uniref:O-antigen ligase family protein n=1 Tax=Crenobacter caeni TaxID=2705474 RepID=A0A6B2KTT4_9NEIS|nr:O-antigen ligase family protein [Crenobacter caeni]NDV13470.1 O-antigen ligase family protein [Crenobacter caeni]
MKVININRNIRYLLIGLLCLYPVVGARVFPLGDGGRYLSVLAAPVSVLLIGYAISTRQFSLRDGWSEGGKWLLPLLPFTFAFWVSTLIHPGTEMHGETFSRIIYGALLFIAARLLGVRVHHLLWAGFFAGLVYFVIAIHDVFMLSPERMSSGYKVYLGEDGAIRAGGGSNPIHFGQVTFFLFGMLVLGVFSGAAKHDVKVASLWLLSIALLVVATLLTLSRGPLLAIVPLVLLVFYIADQSLKKWIAVLSFSGVVLAGIALVAYPDALARIMLAWTEVHRYFTEPSFTFSSVGARLEMWRIALLAWSKNPLFGMGFVSYSQLQADMPLIGVIDPVVASHVHFHNDYMQSVVQGGAFLLSGLVASQLLIAVLHRKNVYILFLVFSWVFFSFVDLLFFKKSMLTMFVSVYALFAAAEINDE